MRVGFLGSDFGSRMEEGLVMETRQEAQHAADTDLVTDAQYVFFLAGVS